MGLAEIVAAGGMRNLLEQQHVIADNLANAATSGFRRTQLAWRSLPPSSGLEEPSAPPPGAGVLPLPFAHTRLDAAPGPREETGNPLDLALEGDGFLVVATPRGERYLRTGSFRVDANGVLCTREGWPLLGEDGSPITVEGGDIRVSREGDVQVDGNDVGRLRRVSIPISSLRSEGGVLAAADGTPVRPSSATVCQGCLEGANVDTVTEMVRMMENVRGFELLQQVVRAEDEMAQAANSQVARLQ